MKTTLFTRIIAFAAKVPAAGGNVEVPVQTNLPEYMVMVDPANQWIKYVETKAVRNETLVFSVEENTSEEERSGVVIIMADTPMRYTIVQEGKSDTPPVETGGGSADLETINGGAENASFGTYTTTNGWTAVEAKAYDIYNVNSELFAVGTVRPHFRGKSGQEGSLTSPFLTGGCGTVTIKWYRGSTKTGNTISVDIKNSEGTVLKTESHTNPDAAQYAIQETSFEMNVAGDFQMVINNVKYNTGRTTMDAIGIIDVTWTGYSE